MNRIPQSWKWGGLAFLAVGLLSNLAYSQTNLARTGRFYRGGGTNASYHSFVLPLDFQQGVALDNLNGNGTNLFPGLSLANRYHYDATKPGSSTNNALRIPFNNPMVAFGSRVGGSPLYFDQEYHFGAYAGVTAPFSTDALYVDVFRQSDFTLVDSVVLEIPALSDTNAWRNFLTNGFQKTTTAYGLTTTLRFDDLTPLWGMNYEAGGYHLTHTATPTATNYVYVIRLAGYTDGDWMVTANDGYGAWSRLYSIEFQQRPPWRAVYLDQRHFSGTPAPSEYYGKSAAELLTNAPPITNAVSLAPSACTNLDASPELRRHPTLDQFVTDMRRDPIALANYVQNEIELTDAIAYNDNGAVSDISINLGGVNRSALGTFMEKQGSPIEQCALLVYLLRQAGVPAVYVFPPENSLKMLDTQLSQLLRMQIHGAINNTDGGSAPPYTTNSLIAVNYPWVAAYVGTNWVHLFPWLKDTEVREGLNLYDYMPTNYTTSYQWVKDYLYGKTNILGLSADDDTPQTLFPLYVKQVLSTNAPGISLDDVGMQMVNRRHAFNRWQDFPRPPVVTNTSIAVESLGASAITNVNSRLTNIFDTLSVTVSSVANPNTKLATGTLRMVDLHNRKFLIRHEKISSTQHRLILSLSPYRPDATNTSNFTSDSALLNQQSLTNTLASSDDLLTVQFVHNRHRSLPVGFVAPIHDIPYLGISESTSITNNRTLRKGDLGAICLSVGRVTPQMLRVHAQDLWNMERTLEANPSATNSLSPDVYQGTVAYLMGMAYYEKVGRFDSLNQHLHKVQVQSQFASGLAGIRAARVNNALPNGDIDLIQPSVDMFYRQVVIVGNTTLRLDSGDDGNVPNDDYFHLNLADGSAQEHAIINRFFRQSDAVSTVKLLQLAQAKSATNGQPGILALDSFNYLAEGEKNYPSTGTIKLKNQSTNLWTMITNTFANAAATYENYAQVFITPGPVTNQTGSFKGMGAFLIQPAGGTAAIAEKNGGYGANNPSGSLAVGNAPNVSLGVDAENNYSVQLTPPSAGNQVVSSSTTPWDQQPYYNALVASQAYPDPALWAAALQANQNNGSFGGSPLEGYRLMNDLGALGKPDWLADSAAFLADPVNAVSGEFYVDAVDLTLPGPMPLQVRRNYSSHNLAENQFGFGWKLSYMPFLSVSTNGALIYAAEPEGSVIAYEQTATNANLWLPNAARNPNLSNKGDGGIGSTANPFKGRIARSTVSGTNHYTLFGADGGQRTFVERSYPIGASFTRLRPYLTRWEDNRGNFYTFEYGEDATKPDYGEVRRLQSGNGSFLGFYYDIYGHLIEAYTGDGRRLFYEYDRYGDLVSVTRPDASQFAYEYQHANFVTNSVTHVYSLHLITRENKPDGRVLVNEYDAQRRVTNQLATVGVDLVPVRNATFVYANNFAFTNSVTNLVTGFTVVQDIFNHTNRYDYTNNLITRVIDSLGQTREQYWYADGAAAPGYSRSLWKTKDQRGLWTEFKYDANGNVTNTVVTGDLTGDGTTQSATNTVVYNANNLPTLITDPVGNKVQTLYHPQFPFLPEYVVRLAGSTPIGTNRMLYTSVTNTVVFGGVTYTNLAIGLLQREVRGYGSADAATNDWAYDGRGFATQSVRYTGTTDPTVTNTFFYNNRNLLAEQTDAAGRKTAYDYDALGRPTLREVFEAGQTTPLAWDYSYYNENGELTWTDGPRYNPEDYVWRDYDGAGRNITEIHWRSQAKADGTGVEAPDGYNLYAQMFREYDGFGNLKRTINPRGAITTNTWDILGRLIQTKSFDLNGTTVLTTEGFAYEPGGQVRYHTNALGGVTETQYTTNGLPKFRKNADGSTNAWRYYVDGRPYREIQGNGAYSQTTHDDANRKTTQVFYSATGTVLATNIAEFDRRGNLVKRTDAGGNVFTNSFDGLDRLKITAGPAITNISIGFGPFPSTTNVVRQVTTYTYDNSGKVQTVANALGDKTITTNDALSRPISVEIRNTNNVLVRATTTAYAANHHGVSVTNGSAGSAVVSTAFTDNNGQPLLSIAYPYAGVREYTQRSYDLAGNLASSARYAATNTTRTFFSQEIYSYDGLNRVTVKSDRDGALTTYAFDPMGNVTNRTMPGGLQWQARFNSAAQLLEEKNAGSGGAATRTNSYAYYATGNSFAGLLQTSTDGRAVVCTHTYNDWLRPGTNTYDGPLAEHDFATKMTYDARGLLTGITETPATGTNSVTRTYDSYGQMSSESVSTGYTATQSWDAAGRRVRLNFGDFVYAYFWRADGLLDSVATPVGGGGYAYNSAGVLTNRAIGSRSSAITSLDGAGRPLSITTKVSLVTKLTETLAWTGDGLLSAHTLDRVGDFTDSRAYSYANLTRRLTEERLNLDGSKRWTNSFAYDGGVAAGPGALTKIGPVSGSARWSGGTDAFSRINTETNVSIRRPAYGKVNGPATLTASLDGAPQPVSVYSVNDAQWTNRWNSTLEIPPGAHQLIVSAKHPSGQFTTNASVWFTNSVASERVTDAFDGAGYVTQRIWKSPSGTTNRTQNLSWDARGRLVKATERDASTNGYDWLATYDPFGRRVQARTFIVTNGVTLTAAKTALPFFDPLVEFLELGVNVDGQTTWKIYGPDLNGAYGGLNGTGGLDAVAPGLNAFNPTISDARGNVLGAVTNGIAVNWTGARVTGYGAVPGYRPLPLGHGGDVVTASAWRGRAVDITSFVNLGARPYNPESGAFESFDPSWNGRDPNGYTAGGGDMINYFDADGRLAKGIGGGFAKGDFYQAGNVDQEMGQFLGQIGGGLTPVWGQISDFRDTTAAANAIRTDGLGWGTGIGMVLSTAAWVPGVGDAIKGFGKSILRAFDDVPVSSFTPPGGGGWTPGGGGMPTQMEFGFVPFVERQTVARDFYRETTSWSDTKIAAHMQGINFSQSVTPTQFPAGTPLVQYQLPGNPVGNYFAPPGTPANTLGIYTSGLTENNYILTQPALGLRSTAASAVDNWSMSGFGWRIQTTGGGQQNFIPNAPVGGK